MAAKQLKVTGTLAITLNDRAVPGPMQLDLTLNYSQKAVLEYDFATAQTDLAVSDGSITAPKAIFVELREGTIDLKWDTNVSSVPTRLSMDADPLPTERAKILLFTPVGTARTLYLSSVAGFKADVWLLQ